MSNDNKSPILQVYLDLESLMLDKDSKKLDVEAELLRSIMDNLWSKLLYNDIQFINNRNSKVS